MVRNLVGKSYRDVDKGGSQSKGFSGRSVVIGFLPSKRVRHSRSLQAVISGASAGNSTPSSVYREKILSENNSARIRTRYLGGLDHRGSGGVQPGHLVMENKL